MASNQESPGTEAPQTVRAIRAVRGAITVERDDATSICAATRTLLDAMLERNHARADDVISVIFTVSPDLRSEFPARAARDLGWDAAAMLCMVEMPVPGALERCVRVLLHVELPVAQRDVKHTYLGGAAVLRPDL